MPAPQVTDDFLEILEKSRLLSHEQIVEVIEKLGLQADALSADVAAALIQAGKITRFQADRLLEGRHRGFFIDRYRSDHILGTGGMGWLYLSTDIDSGNQVAVKMLPKRLEGDAGMTARFQLEAMAGMKLNHPNIVRTFEYQRTDGVYGDVFYVVMELIRGVSIEELVTRNGPVPWPQACDVIRQAASGLQHAHENGTIHRDVKPANLLIDITGHVKIADFGLSKIESEADEEFSLQMIFGHDCLGTADYIAPEQTLDSNAVDGRADIYGLGCTFYATLTGKLPFPLKSAKQKLEAQRTRKPRPVAGLVENLPAEIPAILEKMMAKRPEHRFQTAQDVCRALSRFACRQPVEFSFEDTLLRRADAARKKIAAKQAHRTGGSSVVAGRSATAHSAIETTIRDKPH
ncbi:MAG: serine/threonine-protein kinase [Planctomycetaceae bacterium]